MEIKLALDVDETLLDSSNKHTRILNGVFGNFGLPTLSYEEVQAKGGTRAAYGHYEGYPRINEAMRNSPSFNKRLPPIEGAVEGVQALAGNGCKVVEYLTTRPAHLQELTHNELTRLGFPDLPVVARPESVPFERTTEWKIQELQGLVGENTAVVMIDDSVSLCRAINGQHNPHLMAVVFEGPITPVQQARSEGLITAGWQNIVSVIDGLFGGAR